MDRQSGRTTKQMQEAPKGALFVWVNHHLQYPKALARSLARDDLCILSPDILQSLTLAGLNTPIIVDHAATLTPGQLDALNYYEARLRLRGHAQGQR